VTDRPRLVGWSSLHRERRRSLTPLVATQAPPRRFQDRREARLRRGLATRDGAFTCTAKIADALRLALQERGQSRRLPSCHDRPGFPRAAERRSPSGWRATRGSRTFLASESPLRASARRAETSPASAAASTLFAESPNEAALGVRRTDFCLLTFRTSTRASLVPELRHARGKRARIREIAWFTSVRFCFGGPHHPLEESPLWALSSRAVCAGRASGTSVASLSTQTALARECSAVRAAEAVSCASA
jgi:hypothetical protein